MNLTSPCGRSAWVAGGAATALAVLWGLAAADSAATPIQVRSDPDAMRLLRNAATAAQSTPYHGTEFLTAWHGGTSTTSTIAVAHVPGDGTLLRTGTAGGAKGGLAGLFEPDSGRGQPGLGGYTPVMLDLLTRNYTVVRSADDRICGRAAQVVEARRADGSAAGRFWIDQTTGIMLYRELLDRKGRTIVAAGFQDLTVALPAAQAVPDAATTAPATVGLMAGSWNHELTRGELNSLPGAGPDGTSWKVPRGLPGNLSLYVAKEESTGGADKPVQLGYTDGLFAMSIFVQRGVLDSAKFAGWRRATVHGRTVFERAGRQYWRVWAAHGQVYTVVGDADPATTDAVVSALPRGGPGLWQRLDRGLHRLAGWANPFG